MWFTLEGQKSKEDIEFDNLSKSNKDLDFPNNFSLNLCVMFSTSNRISISEKVFGEWN